MLLYIATCGLLAVILAIGYNILESIKFLDSMPFIQVIILLTYRLFMLCVGVMSVVAITKVPDDYSVFEFLELIYETFIEYLL
jgi:hypothetical protein